jgi:hypothetical protein
MPSLPNRFYDFCTVNFLKQILLLYPECSGAIPLEQFEAIINSELKLTPTVTSGLHKFGMMLSLLVSQ